MAKYSEQERKILDEWPTVTAMDVERINDLFPHYLFYRYEPGAVKLWTSCCGHHERLEYVRRTDTPEQRELLDSLDHKSAGTCPWCGRKITRINLSKAGKRKSLSRYEPVVLLHSRGGVLYADAIGVRKDYDTEAALTAPPERWVSSGYRFTPGEVMEIDHQYGVPWYISYERERLGSRKKVQEPFKIGMINWYQHEHYAILNREALNDCPVFRYCGFFDRWEYRPGGGRGYAHYFRDFISYLTAAAIYPRQVELLSKTGLWQPLSALIFDRKKFAGAMCWEEPDIRKSFGLDKKELHWFLAVQPRMEVLEVRNYVKRWWGKTWSLPDCVDFCNLWGVELSPMTVLRFLKGYRLEPDRFLFYLDRVFEENEGYFQDLFEIYRDYLDAAYNLGRCMEHGKVLWPEDLFAAHDEATEEWTRRQRVAERQSVAVSGKARRLKYEFELDGLQIQFPLTGAAIRREGKLLHHCVGGYADRHITGVLSILFLRRADQPKTAYVTIEMHGNTIQQIHGWDDERTVCEANPGRVSPRVLHKEFLDTWLRWLRNGSKRDKDGKPMVHGNHKKKKEEVA